MKITKIIGSEVYRLSQLSHTGHTAWDIAVPQGTELYSPGTGKVSVVKLDASGNSFVQMKFPKMKIAVEYIHCSHIDVSAGDSIIPGQLIGLSGGTPGTYGAGKSSGPHLHLQVRDLTTSKLLNPSKYFST
jgi:murein DD-endopeptidase MepM/ murein hydrolase activator NlpD